MEKLKFTVQEKELQDVSPVMRVGIAFSKMVNDISNQTGMSRQSVTNKIASFLEGRIEFIESNK